MGRAPQEKEIARWLTMRKALLLAFLLLVGYAWSTPSVLLKTERHRTEWHFVNYRFLLVNTSSFPILNAEIRYYAVAAPLAAAVDYSSGINPVFSSASQVGDYAVVKFTVQGILFPGDSVEIHCRIYKLGWTAWDSSNDWSYQKNPEVSEPNYYMTVYDGSRNILWGFDPLNGNRNASDVVLWIDRGGHYTVEGYDGNATEIIPAGRFWMLKNLPISPMEQNLLAELGIVKYSVGRHQDKTLALFRSDVDVPKRLLDSLVSGFYNTIAVDDSTPVEIEFYQDSLFDDTSKIELGIYCWPDVSVNDCFEGVSACGGTEIGVTRGLQLANVRKDSLQCLTHNRNIDGLVVQHELGLTSSSVDRDAVNISVLQNDSAWQAALQMDIATTNWLSGVEYTGEGIVAGVYDTGIDFLHPDFNEDSSGIMVPRRMRAEEYFGLHYNSVDSAAVMGGNKHGTEVAGLLGGNGNASDNFVFRGVAPKVHFYSGEGHLVQYNQVGHVVNHSHVTSYDGWYNEGDYSMDAAIFNNWKSSCTKINPNSMISIRNCVEGDTLVKTVVFGAGNNGDYASFVGYYYCSEENKRKFCQLGYHSILSNSKNAITVGNITSEEKVRFHNSSMGPTWDGRIKPDVMAPGAMSQLSADLNKPVEIMIDYVKIYRQVGDSLYFTLDAEENVLDTAKEITTCDEFGIDTLPNGENVFDCKIKKSAIEINIGWKLIDSIRVRKTDSLEIRFKPVQGWGAKSYIFGKVYFGKDDSSFYGAKGHVDVSAVWNADTAFSVTKIPLMNREDSIDVHFIRLDFRLVWGVISPMPCKGGACDYDYPIDGGTSASAPFVSGIAALMYQKFRDTTGEQLDKHSMRNSTIKALMIHTAKDMADSPETHFSSNPDLDVAHRDGQPHYTPYGEGPDFATGWGMVDGAAALNMISGYDSVSKKFSRFREIEIGNGVEKRWMTKVGEGQRHLRVTLVWDDAPGIRDNVLNPLNRKISKLVNDLDMYLVSPSGQYHYPWRLDPLPNEYVDSNGNSSDFVTGFENIHEADVHDAYNGCSVGNKVGKECFDHLNNVEVVDVDNPEPGKWQIVVLGRNVEAWNDADSNAQVATLVSDSALSADERCGVVHDYAPQTEYRCTYVLGKDAISYVTFDERTFVGAGDYIQLSDERGNLIGIYTENQLAGKKLKLRSQKLTVILHSDNDKSQGWGFGISNIKIIPNSALKMPFEFTKRIGDGL